MNLGDVLPLVNPDAEASTAAKAVLLEELEKRNKDRARLEDALRLVDDDIRSLRKRWNGLASVSRLPPEILSIIFEVFVTDYCECRRTGNNIRGTSLCGWLVVLRICHHWRNVALGNPKIWTHIELNCEPHVQFALAHSGTLPLTVFSPWWSSSAKTSESDAIIRSLFPEFQRLRSAQLYITPTVELALDFAHAEGQKLQAPILDTLTLKIDKGVIGTRFPVLSEMDLPSLTSLTIEHGALVLSKRFVRPTLTTLDLAFSPYCTPSLLVEILDGLPSLQHLALSGIGDNNPPFHLLGQTPPWCHIISLLQLRSLSMEGHLYSLDIVHLLECLHFPVDTKITFAMVIEGYGDFAERYHQIMPRVMRKSLVCDVSAASRAAQTVSPRAIEVLFNQRVCPAFDVIVSPTLRPWDRRRTFEINPAAARTLHLTIASREEDSIIRFFSLVDLSEVIVMDIEQEYEAAIWRRAFRNRDLPKLQDLILRSFMAVLEVVSAMSTPLSTEATKAPASGKDIRRCLFPTLKTLTLSLFQFRNRPDKVLRGDQFPVILKALRVRAKHGYKLEKLVIHWPINLTRKEDRDALSDPRIADSVEIDSGDEEVLWSSDEDEVEESDIDSDDDVKILGEN